MQLQSLQWKWQLLTIRLQQLRLQQLHLLQQYHSAALRCP